MILGGLADSREFGLTTARPQDAARRLNLQESKGITYPNLNAMPTQRCQLGNSELTVFVLNEIRRASRDRHGKALRFSSWNRLIPRNHKNGPYGHPSNIHQWGSKEFEGRHGLQENRWNCEGPEKPQVPLPHFQIIHKPSTHHRARATKRLLHAGNELLNLSVFFHKSGPA